MRNSGLVLDKFDVQNSEIVHILYNIISYYVLFICIYDSVTITENPKRRLTQCLSKKKKNLNHN